MPRSLKVGELEFYRFERIRTVNFGLTDTFLVAAKNTVMRSQVYVSLLPVAGKPSTFRAATFEVLGTRVRMTVDGKACSVEAA